MRPAKIRILGKIITIHYVPEGDRLLKDSEDDKEPGSGRSDSDKQIIAIEDGQPLESEQDTVLHEVLHIIEDYGAMDIPDGVVQWFATGLLAVLKDNPKFISYLRRKK